MAGLPGSNASDSRLDFRNYTYFDGADDCQGPPANHPKNCYSGVGRFDAEACAVTPERRSIRVKRHFFEWPKQAFLPSWDSRPRMEGLTRTTDGPTITFTGNPVGLVQAMAKKGFISSFQDQDDFTKFLPSSHSDFFRHQ